jgi:ribose-phosphate pyrophosphokinase
MKYSNPSDLAVIACPGGEVFANELVGHLKNHFRRIFDKTVSEMGKRYGMDQTEVMRHINFVNELTSIGSYCKSKDLKLHVPRFKIPARFTMFANGEIKAEILASIREKDLYIVQDVENHHPLSLYDGAESRSLSVNDHLLTLITTIDAAKQAGAARITLVLPIYPYSRQHKKKGREGVTANLIGTIMEDMGVQRIITLDLHSRDIANGFQKMRIENLHASYQILRQLAHIVPLDSEDLVIVAPDTGAVDRNKFYASTLKRPLAMIYKERDYSKVSKNAKDSNIKDMKILGDVKDKIVFMADDMLGTGGTMINAMKFLKNAGASMVICAVSLPLFSGNAIYDFDEAYKNGLFYRIIGTNAVYQDALQTREWYSSVNISMLFAQIITRLHQGESLSSILDNRRVIMKSSFLKDPKFLTQGTQPPLFEDDDDE